jgi:hypothetical protein
MPTVRYSDPPDNVMTTDEECAELASIPIHLRAAHSRSSNHRLELLASARCACFACCRHFAPGAIVEWTDFDATGQGQTAICAEVAKPRRCWARPSRAVLCTWIRTASHHRTPRQTAAIAKLAGYIFKNDQRPVSPEVRSIAGRKPPDTVRQHRCHNVAIVHLLPLHLMFLNERYQSLVNNSVFVEHPAPGYPALQCAQRLVQSEGATAYGLPCEYHQELTTYLPTDAQSKNTSPPD